MESAPVARPANRRTSDAPDRKSGTPSSAPTTAGCALLVLAESPAIAALAPRKRPASGWCSAESVAEFRRRRSNFGSVWKRHG